MGKLAFSGLGLPVATSHVLPAPTSSRTSTARRYEPHRAAGRARVVMTTSPKKVERVESTESPESIENAKPIENVKSAETVEKTKAPSDTKLPGASRSKSKDPDLDDRGLHISWRVYEQEGNLCVICGGDGVTKCLHCFGEGIVFVGALEDRDGTGCPQCKGEKVVTCPRCEGSGIRPATRLNPFTCELVPNITNEDVRNGVPQPTYEGEFDVFEGPKDN